MPELFLADVSLNYFEGILNDGESTTFHTNLSPCLTSVVYINQKAFKDAERQLDVCLFYQL